MEILYENETSIWITNFIYHWLVCLQFSDNQLGMDSGRYGLISYDKYLSKGNWKNE